MNPEVFKQAQSRGWMEGIKFLREEEIPQNNGRFSTDFIFHPGGMAYHERLSLNDILFGTDFCEKFFSEECSSVDCKWIDCSWRLHRQSMLDMSESERITFLEKHLEVKEEQPTAESMGFSRPEPKEIKKIPDIPQGMDVFIETINKLVDQVNANTNAIDENKKNCRLNMN